MPLHFVASKAPLSIAHQKALASLYALFPPRFAVVNIYVQQVPAREWKHGIQHYGWTDTSGNVSLLAGRWQNLPGLALHELGHAWRYTMLSPAQWATWEAFYLRHKGELGTDYARTNAEEGFAEGVVCVLRPGLPNYRAASASALAMVRGLLK